jgi:hypothetical protein
MKDGVSHLNKQNKQAMLRKYIIIVHSVYNYSFVSSLNIGDGKLKKL